MKINITTATETVTAIETEYNPETENYEATTFEGGVYVEVQLSKGQVEAAEAYEEYLKSEYYTAELPLHGFGTYLIENYG